MNSKQGLIILAVILGILLIGSGIWGFRLNSDKKELQSEKDQLSMELGDLNELKTKLEQDIDSLQIAFDGLATENESLEGSLAEARTEIANKIQALKATKKSSASEINNLRAEIEALIDTKTALESNINALQTENDSLRAVTGVLERDLGQAKLENRELVNLNTMIQDEVKRLTLANFKASAFQVELEKKSSKATAKSRRARRIKTTFDLTNVPEKYHGVRPLYLVISDEKATPIQLEKPIEARVMVNGQPVDLIAAEAKEVNIETNQRLSFTHDLAEKLKAGYYRAAVYTDIGLLGATSFRLQ
ncbi:MAG: hypothetical protein DHS20C18_01250 [Saprospiraceae bacterium]|nr:MAG: hypothetical protein DHS20C18_01250 [Saprospiraceae bacterium]